MKEVYEKIKSLCSTEQLNTFNYYLEHFKNPDFNYKMLPLTKDGGHMLKSTINMGIFNLEIYTFSKELVFTTQIDFKSDHTFKMSFGYEVYADYYFCSIHINDKNLTGESLDIRYVENQISELMLTSALNNLKIKINTNFLDPLKSKEYQIINNRVLSKVLKNYLNLNDIQNLLLIQHDLFTFDDDIILGIQNNSDILNKELNKHLKNKNGVSFD